MKAPGKFYCNFEELKPHNEGTPPPERPIVSGCGSVVENIGVFVEQHLKPLASCHDTYLKDTPNCLQQTGAQNDSQTLQPDTIIVTMDVSGLFTNIPHEDGTQSAREALNERVNCDVPTEIPI